MPKSLKNRYDKNHKLALLFLLSIFLLACQPPIDKVEPAFESKGANIKPTPSQNLTEFESELKAMRTVGFYHIYTLKRKDGATFEKNDKKFVRENIHYATNRTSFIEDDTILFIGTNYKPSDEQILALKKRFEFGDYSKTDEQIEQEKAEKKAKKRQLRRRTQIPNKAFYRTAGIPVRNYLYYYPNT